MKPRRVVFLMSDSGGGHRAAADAIRAGLDLCYPCQFACELVDVYRRYTRFPFTYMPEIYAVWVNRAQALWRWGFKSADSCRRAALLSALLGRYWGVERLGRMIEDHPADVIVSVHTLFSRPAAQALKRLGAAHPPLVTVVTDLVTAHALAYSPDADRCFVPTQAAYDRGVRCGLHPGQLRVTGLPVHPRFAAARQERSQVRARLGWDADLPVVLLLGGSEGMGPLYRIARALDARHLHIRLVIVAGRNRQLRHQLERSVWHQPTEIHPFVSTMHEFMAAADMLVTKAGPATIGEACAAGLPMVLSGRIAGQEDGNIGYVVEHDAGCYAPGPRPVADAVTRWLAEGRDRLAQRAAAAQSLARPSAVIEIAREIHHLAERGPVLTGAQRAVPGKTPRLGCAPEDGWLL